MHGKKCSVPILLAALIMLLAVGIAIAAEAGSLLDRIHFYDSMYHIELSLFYDETEEIYYLFLPSYAGTKDILAEHENVELGFEADGISYGDSIAALPLEQDIVMNVSGGGGRTEQYTLQIWQCRNLPTVYIETQSGTLDDVNSDKNNKEDVAVLIVNADGDLSYQGMGELSGHGNSSWEKTKRPYNLTFPSEIDAIGFEQVKDLCFFAEYSDESKMHNSIAYYMGDKLDIPYASQYVYVDVYANGEYIGMYGAVTKKEYLKYVDTDDIQAVFEIASSAKDNYFSSEFGWCIQVMYGETEAVKQTVNEMEEALADQDFARVERLIDLESFAQRYALEEFVANYDLVLSSKYFYIDGSGVIHCMLPWDYDWSFGSYAHYFSDFITYSITAYEWGRAKYSWFTLLLDDERFVSQVSDVLGTRFTDAFLADVAAYVEETADKIEDSYNCDRVRYQNEVPYFYEWDASSGIETLEGFVEYFQMYLTARTEFLTDYFLNRQKYCVVAFQSNVTSGNLCVPVGADLWDYLNEDSNILHLNAVVGPKDGWRTQEGWEPQDISAVTEDITFYGEIVSVSASEDIKTDIMSRIGRRLVKFSAMDGFEFTVMGGFGLLFLLLVLAEVSNGRFIMKRKRRDVHE